MRVEPAEVLQMSFVSILVADDFQAWRDFVVSNLQKVPGMRVSGVAYDGLDAVQKAKELQPDLVLLDLAMPKLNGLEAARQIAKVAPGTKILFVSSTPDADVVRASFVAGGSGYILKSDAEQDLLAGIEAVLLGKRFVSARLARFDRPADSQN